MDLSGWMNATINVAEYAGTNDGHGNPNYSSVAAMQARVEEHVSIVTAQDGTERVSSHRIFALSSIGEQARIWLEGESTSDLTLARYPIGRSVERDKSQTIRFYVILV